MKNIINILLIAAGLYSPVVEARPLPGNAIHRCELSGTQKLI